ncbi:Ferric iron ABC transporter, permease protein [hydrothermal vent metagenome]|uniref:Ferric iron ABC transporter, permease protein n=1 Tax=hydrothermal vent metagenome TaxID=652676 RepID=A0A3B1AXT3_9ZZZZ
MAALVALVIATPILTILSYLFHPGTDTWQHLADTVLADYVSNSLLLMLGVAIGAGSIGITTAWLTSMYSFPGRRLFIWSLLLPLAMPAYIIAYTYTGMFEVAGPVQEWIRETFNLRYGQYWFPEIRSLGGAITMLSLVLYPYVYLLARAAFLDQSVCALEASRTLGCGPWRSFITVALPLARPAIVTGISLALMETLADYGTVQYFGISTFTTGIFRTWFGLDDSVAAAQLSGVLMTFVFTLILLEQWSRKQARFHHATNRYQSVPNIRLSPLTGWVATIACFIPLFLGFLLPVGQLSYWAVITFSEMVNESFYTLVLNSFMLAGAAAVLTLIPALILGYGNRNHPTPVSRFLVRLSGMGYAIPGTVIAIGVLIPFGILDNSIDAWMLKHFNVGTGLIFSGTIFILLFAYMVRFFTISLNTVEAGLATIRPSMDAAALTMGYSGLKVLRKVHLPMMKGSLLTALIIVFVDVLKELPATLVLRPFNFNTLAVRAFELASDERLADSSTAAIAIVLVSIVPVILLSRTIAHARPGQAK